MDVIGTVREWHDDDGWGLIDSTATPGGCWAHYSAIQMPGFRRLSASDEVRLTFEEADQDGYRFRAVGIWPPGLESVSGQDEGAMEGSAAYRSSLRLNMDDDGPKT